MCMSLENNLEEFRSVEESKVRKRLAALPRDRIYDYFDGIDSVLKDLNEQRLELEADEALRIENLRETRALCNSARKELDSLKEKLLHTVKSHENERSEAMKSIHSKAPDLVDYVQKLSEMKARLIELKFAQPFEMELENIKVALVSRDYDSVLSRYEATILETSRVPSSVAKQFEQKAGLLDDFLVVALQKDLYQLYQKIRFPFEFSIDFRAVRSDLETSVQILRCLHIISNRKREKSVVELLSLVTKLFEDRFNFHFWGTNKTNNPAKPEWFFKQVLDWISYNGDYFSVYLQRVCDMFDCEETADGIFIKCLIMKVKDKVQSLLTKGSFMSNRIMFSHLLDESIAFSNEINQLCENGGGLPDIMSLFMKTEIIDEWVELEKDAIAVGIDEVLADPHAYECRFEEARDIDKFIVPNFASTFIILMKSMSERYMMITVAFLRSRFLKHQLLIIDEFLSRIARIFHETESPWHVPYPALMNSVWFIGVVLEEWNSEDQFIELSGIEGKQSLARGPFDESADLYRHEWRKRAKHLITSFRNIISNKVRVYAAQNWFQMNHSKPLDFSPSLSDFVDEISQRIRWLRDNISEDSRLSLYHLINFEVWDCLMVEVVSSNSFTHKAAAQMLFDFQEGLIPLLNKAFIPSKRSLNQESGFRHFSVLKEKRCCEVLNVLRLLALPSPTAILLRDEVQRIPESMVHEKTAPFGIVGFNREQLLLLFEQRCDMHRIS
uniref:RAD50-interacting protein 1 n=1 Tax=Bursaphelenchus xylophilus TaxID=6326 RepID=A0A1I7RQX8_BURXY